MESADLASGGEGGQQHLGAEQAAGVNQALAAVETNRFGDRSNDIIWDCDDHQLHFVENGGRLHERSDTWNQAAESLAAGGVAAGHGDYRPAGARDRHSQRRAYRPRSDDADVGDATSATVMRVRLQVRVDLVAVMMAPHTASERGRIRAVPSAGRAFTARP